MTQCPHWWFLLKIHGEGGSSFVQHRPQKTLDGDIERFFASLRFDHREPLDQMGLEPGTFDPNYSEYQVESNIEMIPI